MKRMLTIVLPAALIAVVLTGVAADSKSVALFNGEDFTGWKLFLPDENADPADTWSVKDGVIHCTGTPVGYMRTEKEYENYRLRVEWRFPGAPGNSGVLLHVQGEDVVWPKSIEAQLQHEHAGDIWVIGGTTFKEHTDKSNRRVLKKEKSSEKPPGEWNQYEIICRDDSITLYVNGVLQNQATECTVTKGAIGLQSEGAPIEFRNIVLEPLEDDPPAT